MQGDFDENNNLEVKQKEGKTNKLDQMHNLFMQTPVAIHIFKGPDLIIELANKHSLELWGREADVVGQPLLQAFPELKAQGIAGLMNEVIQTGKAKEFYETPVVLKRKGVEEAGYFNFVFQPYYESDSSKPVGVLAVSSEVTERINARKELAAKEQSLKESADKFSNLLESIPHMTWTHLPSGEVNFFNDKWYSYTGLNFEQTKAWRWKAVVHPDDLLTIEKVYTEALQTGSVFETESRYRRADGEYRWHLNRALPLKNDKGEIFLWVGTATDIDDRKQTEKALLESEEKLRSVISAAPAGIGLFMGRDLIVELPNKTFIDIVGKGKDIEGKPLREVMPELITENQPYLKLLDDVFTTGKMFQSFGSQVKIVQNGVMTYNYYNITYSPLFNKDNEVYAILDIAIDVTEQVLTKQALEESERNLRNMILQAPVAMCILSGPDYVVEIANERMFELWGKSSEALLHKPIFEGLPEAKEQGLETLLHKVFTTGETFKAFEMPVDLPRGNKIETTYLNFVYEPLYDNGIITSIMAVAVEVTEQVIARRKIEEVVAERTKQLAEANLQLQQSNIELNQFAYIASHDLQEPLRKVRTFTELMQSSLGEVPDKAKHYINRIHSSTERMQNLINDVLEFSQISKEKDKFETVDLGKILASVISDYELLIEQKNASIVADALPVIEAIPFQINQLFSNLISNALKFSNKEKQPEIIITTTQLLKEEVKRHKELDEDKVHYQIEFKDNGIGFNQENAQQIFTIFQRLHGRSEYEGTGIGLAICKKITMNHHGTIYAHSSLDEGASFTIILPQFR